MGLGKLLVGVLAVAATVYGWQSTSSQQSTPDPSTVTLAQLEDQGIYLTLPAQVDRPITRDLAEQVASDNGSVGKVTNAFLAQLRDQMGSPGPNGPEGFTGPVWVVEFDPNTSGMVQPLGPGGGQSFTPGYAIVFIDARNGDFLVGTSMGYR